MNKEKRIIFSKDMIFFKMPEFFFRRTKDAMSGPGIFQIMALMLVFASRRSRFVNICCLGCNSKSDAFSSIFPILDKTLSAISIH